MNCRDVVRHLHEYLDGELPGAKVEQIGAPLHQCEHCQRFLASYRKTIQLFRRTLDHDLSPEASRHLWQILERKLEH